MTPKSDLRQIAYDALKRYGHSPAKAAEIVLDVERGDHFARRWLKLALVPPSKDSDNDR